MCSSAPIHTLFHYLSLSLHISLCMPLCMPLCVQYIHLYYAIVNKRNINIAKYILYLHRLCPCPCMCVCVCHSMRASTSITVCAYAKDTIFQTAFFSAFFSKKKNQYRYGLVPNLLKVAEFAYAFGICYIFAFKLFFPSSGIFAFLWQYWGKKCIWHNATFNSNSCRRYVYIYF